MVMWMFWFMIKFCLVWWVKPFGGGHSQIVGSKPFIVGNALTLGLCCALSVLMKVAVCPDTKFIEFISCNICSPFWTKHFQNTQYASEFASGWKYVSPDIFYMDDAQTHLDSWIIHVGCVMNLRQNFITQQISSHPFYRETGQTWERKCRSSFVPFCMGDNARISTLLKISPWVIHLMSRW
jgi:hypothetical protein